MGKKGTTRDTMPGCIDSKSEPLDAFAKDVQLEDLAIQVTVERDQVGEERSGPM